MDISSVASYATSHANAKVQQTAELAVLKKAIDIQAEGALQLLQAIPSTPALSSSGGVAGQVIHVTA